MSNVPPLPKPKMGPDAPSGGTKRAQGSTGARSGSTAGSSPSSSSPLRRAPGTRKLEEKVARMYMVLGTVIVPIKRWVPQVEPISDNLKVFSQDAAEAWVDLAEDDPKVKKWLESITGASAWGNVIAIHFSILSAAIVPIGIQGAMKMTENSDLPDDIMDMARAAGISDEEIASAMKAAQNITSDRPVEPPKRNKPPPQGIVTPDNLGVTSDGQQMSTPIPADSQPPKG